MQLFKKKKDNLYRCCYNVVAVIVDVIMNVNHTVFSNPNKNCV